MANISLKLIHPGNGNGRISKIYQMPHDETTVNSLRKVIRACATVHEIDSEMDKIQLQLNEDLKIYYKDIQTKQGLATKTITFEELFKRGGKIFD